MKKTLRIYAMRSGKEPFTDWLLSLKDKPTRARLRNRIDRLKDGNYGDYKSIGHGVYELRIDFGPGYRIYYAKVGNDIVLLLAAGNKSSQKTDIAKAKVYWLDFKERYDKIKT